MSHLRLIYVTVNNKKNALELSRELVSKKLVACANILEGMISVYCWQNSIEESEEAIMILKTVSENVERIEHYLQKHHTYEIPCILSIKVEKGNEEFVKWVENSCKVAY